MIPDTAVQTPTFKKFLNGRWHIARLCAGCRTKIWVDVNDKHLVAAGPPWCGNADCGEAAGVPKHADVRP